MNKKYLISATVEDRLLLVSDSYNIKPLRPTYLHKIIHAYPHADLIYFDEEKIDDETGKKIIWRKPDYSPDLLMSCNYFGKFVLIRQDIFDAVGGFTEDDETDDFYDLFLKCVEHGAIICHIPEVIIKRCTLEKAVDSEQCKKCEINALKAALIRRNTPGDVISATNTGIYTIHYHVTGNPKISILIPTRNHGADLRLCLDSIIKKTHYDNWEIIIADNGTTEKSCLNLFDEYQKLLTPERFKVLKIDKPFNFSELNNTVAKAAEGDYLLLLNNDIELITEGWMEKMLGYAQQKHVGAVGVKLIYVDETIQHAGIVLGIGGMAGHSHKGYGRDDSGYFGQLKAVSNYSAVTAAMMMVSKKKYFEVGGLNQVDLKVAFNDVDFCLKLLEKGYYNVVLPQVEAYHYESKSRGTSQEFEQQQREHREADYIRKHWQKYLDNDPFYHPHLTRRKEDFSEMIFPENTIMFDYYRAFRQKLSDNKYLKQK